MGFNHIMDNEQRNAPARPGRHAEIVPRDGSHYVFVDGVPWSRHDDLAKAEAIRQAIVDRWAEYYYRAADVLEEQQIDQEVER
jgi:hypothetical protein